MSRKRWAYSAFGLLLAGAASATILGVGHDPNGSETPPVTIVAGRVPAALPSAISPFLQANRSTLTASSVSPPLPTKLQARPGIYIGADLSYVNTLEQCGLQYRYNDAKADPFDLTKRFGGNVVRVRLFVNPASNTHGDLADATRTIRRARAAGLKVQLDFHYSDNFTDPGHQQMPAAWESLTQDQLVTKIHDYTYETLTGLAMQGLMPDLVQVGNETNGNIVVADNADLYPLNWDRSRPLFNAAIRAVREAGAYRPIRPKVILHVAGPQNVDWWFGEATSHGVTDFDIIGVSYYPSYTDVTLPQFGPMVKQWKAKYHKDVLVVETAYPFTFDYADSTNNNIWTEGLEPGYDASPAGQRDFMIALTQTVLDNGGIGVEYWEPAWSAVPCDLNYVQGSTWENVTWFDWRANNNVHEGITWMSHQYKLN